MKFFKPEDFMTLANGDNRFNYHTFDRISDIANEKLEREGKVVYCQNKKGAAPLYVQEKWHTHKALLIHIEPLETCKHEVEKVTLTPYSHQNTSDLDDWAYICSCGQKLKPNSFKEVE